MKYKKILLIGGSGKLGQAIINSGYFSDILAPSIEELDITKPETIRKFFEKNDFDAIIDCAAIARMKECHDNPIKAIETNVIGTSNLANEVIREEVNGRKVRFIHISTDGVYPGIKGNYSEKDATIPYNKYGWTKLGAECSVNLLSNFCIIRTAFFCPENISYEESAIDSYSSKLKIDELTKAISIILENDFIGTINIGGDRISDYELYKKFKQSLKQCSLNDILKTVPFNMAKDSSMDCTLWKSIKNGIGNRGKVFGTGSSINIEECQICKYDKLEPILFLGYIPPVDHVHKIEDSVSEQKLYPARILYCPRCHLVQIGTIIDAKILFPAEYPYTSGTTKNIRENFAELSRECKTIIQLNKNDLIIDIGSNDGTLLSNFKDDYRVLGITPEDIGNKAIEKGIPTVIDYFRKEVVETINKEYGKAKVITATNVFAHIEDINKVVELILELLDDEGIFIVEVDYLPRIIDELQYDTMHHEHLMYYSLYSMKYLLNSHELEVIHAKEIPTHGGSIRFYSARKGRYPVRETVAEILENEKDINKEKLIEFKKKVIISKIKLHSLLLDIKKKKKWKDLRHWCSWKGCYIDKLHWD